MVAHHILAVVKFISDVGGGVDELIGVHWVFPQLVYQRILEFLRSLFLDSLVLHVVCEDEARIAHPVDVQGGEEEGEPCHQLQEESGGGTVLGETVLEINYIVGEIHLKLGRFGVGESPLAFLVVVQEIDTVLLHSFQHL